MGRRIVYYIPNNNQTLKVNLKKNFRDFKKWLTNKHKSDMRNWDESEISQISFDQIQKVSNFEEFIQLPKQNLDELVCNFVLDYCDLSNNGEKFYEIVYPMVNSWKYNGSTQLINRNENIEVRKLWNYLDKGRSFQNDEPFTPIITSEEKIGFWSVQEQLILKRELDIVYNKLNKDKTLRFLGNIDLLYGIECVLQIIEAVKEFNVEIVINKEEC